MANWFSTKLLSMILPFGFDTEKKIWKYTGLQRGNSNWGNINFVKSESSYYRKCQSIIISQYENRQQQQPLNGENELAFLLTGSKKSWIYHLLSFIIIAQKMKFSIKDFFSKCDQIRSFLRTWSNFLRKSLMENFIFCAVYQFKIFRRSLFEFLTGNFTVVLIRNFFLTEYLRF